MARRSHLPMPEMSARDIDRFWSLVSRAKGCWHWLGNHTPDGYCRFHVNGKTYRAQRLMYWLTTGDDPGALEICHTCDNPPCLNPKHLWPGTGQENMEDRDRKGRQHKGTQLKHARLFEAIVVAIRQTPTRVPSSRLARRYHVTVATVNRVRQGVIWKHVKVPGFKPACRQVRGETAPLAKLTNRQVRDLRQNPPTNQSEAARRLGVSPTTINLILHNKVYKDA